MGTTWLSFTRDYPHTRRTLRAPWLNRDRLFRGIAPQEALGSTFATEGVARIIKHRATLANLDDDQVARLSGHSMRVGAAQDMAAADID